MAKHPKDIKELFDFYYLHVKPLYASVQATNNLPLEVLTEINAAFDHLSRIYQYGADEQHEVKKACSHLKRSCLDIFKIRAKQIVDEYHELKQRNIGIIENGEFELRMMNLFEEIRTGAIEARQIESRTTSDTTDNVASFDAWAPVYEKCERWHKDFFLNPSVEWAMKVQAKANRKQRAIDALIGFAIGVAASVIASYIYSALQT